MAVRYLFRTSVVLLVILNAGCTQQPSQTTKQPIGSTTNGGRPLEQSLPFVIPDLADDELAKPGELAYSGRVLLKVPEDQELPVTANWTDDNRLALEVDGQRPRTIGANVDWERVARRKPPGAT